MRRAPLSLWFWASVVFLFSLGAGRWLLPEFTYSLPHEDNLLQAFAENPSFFSTGIVSNETPVHGAFYFLFLRLSTLFDPNWVTGSAMLLVVTAAAANTVLFLVTATLGGLSAGLLLTTLWAISPFILWNFLEFWNLSFLPFFLLLPIAAILMASRAESHGKRVAALAVALVLLLPATSVHQSSLLILLALAATLATRRGRGLFGLGLPSTLCLLGGFTIAYLGVSTGLLAGDSGHLPHGSILRDLGERLLRKPRWDFAFATWPRSLLTGRHLVDFVLIFLLWVNVRSWRPREDSGASRFLGWLAIMAAPLALYAYAFYFTHPTHFRERYLIMLFLALIIRAAIAWRSSGWPRSRALGWYALGTGAWAVVSFWELRSPGSGAVAIPYGLAAMAMATVFALRARFGIAALVIAFGLHSAAYFSTRHYYPGENAGAFLTIGQGRAIAAFLRETGISSWPEISSSLVLGDFYGLVAYSGISENPRAEHLQPVGCRESATGRPGVLINPMPEPPATCAEGFAQALRFHAPLRALYASRAIALERCDQTAGVGAYLFRWVRGTLREGLANYGLPNVCGDIPVGQRAASYGPLHLRTHSVRTGTGASAGNGTAVYVEIDGTTNRYLPHQAFVLSEPMVTIRCGNQSVREPMAPGENSLLFPRPFLRNTRDLVLSPLRWTVPACPAGAHFRIDWKGLSHRRASDGTLLSVEGPGQVEIRL